MSLPWNLHEWFFTFSIVYPGIIWMDVTNLQGYQEFLELLAGIESYSKLQEFL
jgi:hypothetical protein